MIKNFFLFILFIVLTRDNGFSQAIPTDSSGIKSWSHSGGIGHSISAGPEYLPLFPALYGADVNYRFWYRNANGKKVSDHIVNLSAGYFRLVNQNIFKFKAGDLILLKSFRRPKIRLGIFAEYFVGQGTQVLSFDGHIGLQTRKVYFYVGGTHPLIQPQNKRNINTNMTIGIDYYIFERKMIVN